MSFWYGDPEVWFRQLMCSRRGLGRIVREFEEMRKDIERMFEDTIRDAEPLPKDLVRGGYETPTGPVREVGPLIYGYSCTIGLDGKLKITEFGKVRPAGLAMAGREI